MTNPLQNVWVRIMAMTLTPVLGMLPAAILGYLTWTNPPGDLWIDTGGLVTMGLSGATLSLIIFSIWGVKPPEWALDQNLWKVISGQGLRLLSYSQALIAAALPVSLSGLVTFPDRGGWLFHLGTLPSILGTVLGIGGVGALLTGSIFTAWGWKPWQGKTG